MPFLYNLISIPIRTWRRLAKSRPIRFTRFGTFYILFALGVGAAAINTGNNLLYLILGVQLGFIVISGFFSDSALWGTHARWSFVGSLYAGESAIVECAVTKGRFPGVATTIEAQWSDLEPVRVFAPWIPARGGILLQARLTPVRRGRISLTYCRYATRFPFGLFEKSHQEMAPQTWVVFPHIQRLSRPMLDRLGNDLSARAAMLPGAGDLPYLLRDYRTGDALRHIDWKASAKRQRWMVKEMETEAGRGDLLHLGAWPSGWPEGDMERFVSFTASLVFSLFEEGRPVGLKTPDRFFPPERTRRHLRHVFEYLALVDPAHAADACVPIPAAWRGRLVDLAAVWRRERNSFGLAA